MFIELGHMASPSLFRITEPPTSFLHLPVELRQRILLETLHPHDPFENWRPRPQHCAHLFTGLLSLKFTLIDRRCEPLTEVHQVLSSDLLWTQRESKKRTLRKWLGLCERVFKPEVRQGSKLHETYSYGGQRFKPEDLVEHVKGEFVALEFGSHS